MAIRIPDDLYPTIMKQLAILPRGKPMSPAEIRITYSAAEDEVDLVDIQAHYTPRDLAYEQYISAILQLAHHLRQACPSPMSIGTTLQIIATAIMELGEVQCEGRWQRDDRCCQNCGARGSLIGDDSLACGCCFECGQDFFGVLKPGESWDHSKVGPQVAP